ncbi:MAG: hypothetical protein M1831_006516 [Alyxoria varia]|nr:MAG: hypothetical protein M1831_006516 [Alyxoria varia]
MVSCDSQNSPTASVCTDHADLLVKLNAGHTRVIFTTILRTLFILIPFAGSFAIKSIHRNRAAARDDFRVPLSKLMPWTSTGGAIQYLKKTRKLPGGFWGILVLILGAYALVADLMVNQYIDKTFYAGWCEFEHGVVLKPPQKPLRRGELDDFPNPAFAAATTAVSSQLSSASNRLSLGLTNTSGISWKVPRNDDRFFTSNNEFLGGWSCNINKDLEQKDITFPNSISTTPQGQSDLYYQYVRAGALYDSFGGNETFERNSPLALQSTEDEEQMEAVLAWTASEDDVWDVKAVAVNKIVDSDETYTVTPFNCHLNVTDKNSANSSIVTDIMYTMNRVVTLSRWADSTLGSFLYAPQDSAFYKTSLETHLNAMIMAWGSSNSDWKQADSSEPAHTGDKYGCKVQRTRISIAIWIVVAITLAILLGLSGLGFSLYVLTRATRKWKKVEAMPSDMADWQLAFIQDFQGDNQRTLTAKDLDRFGYGWDHRDGMLRFMTLDERSIPLNPRAAIPYDQEHEYSSGMYREQHSMLKS